MHACSLHNVPMVKRAHVLRARGGWRIWTYYACPAREVCQSCLGRGYGRYSKGLSHCRKCGGIGSWPCNKIRTQKRGGDPVFHNRAFAEAEATRINRGG